MPNPSPAKPLLLLLNDDQSTAGTTPEWCEARDVKHEIHFASHFLDDIARFGGVVIFGGGMQTWDTAKYPWLAEEKKLIRHALDKQIPVFGICLGAQLLAEQLGGTVSSMHRWVVGWYPVVSHVPPQVIPLHWHSASCNVPARIEVTHRNHANEVQGFRASPTVVGFQFHTEIDEQRLNHVLKSWPNLSGEVQPREQIISEAETRMTALRHWYFAQLDAWYLPKTV